MQFSKAGDSEGLDKTSDIKTLDTNLAKNNISDVNAAKSFWQEAFTRLPQANGHKSEIINVFSLIAKKDTAARNVLSVDVDGRVLLWSLENVDAQPRKLFFLKNGAKLAALSFNQDLLALVQEGRVVIIRLADQELKWSLERLKTRISSLSFDPSGEALLLGGVDGRVYRWDFLENDDAETTKEFNRRFERYVGHPSTVSAVAYHPRGRVFFSGDWFGGLSAWLAYDTDLFEGKYDQNIFGGIFYSDFSQRVQGKRDSREPIEQILLSSDGKDLFVSAQTGEIEYWSVRGFKRLAKIKAHQGLVYAMDISAEEKLLVSYGRDQYLKVWRLMQEEDELEQEQIYKFEEVARLDFEDIRVLSFIAKQKLIAGTKSGKIFEIDLAPVLIEEEKKDE